MGDRWHIEVDHGVCIGSGMCVNNAPRDFQLDAARPSIYNKRNLKKLMEEKSCRSKKIIVY